MSPLNDFHCFAIQCCSDAELRRAGSTPVPSDGQPVLSYDAVRNWITTTGFTYDMTRHTTNAIESLHKQLDIGARFYKGLFYR
jgi:hypothetical protein